MKIALIQMDVKIGDPEFNFKHAESLMNQAMENEPDVMILPEMWNTGYDLERANEIADEDGKRTKDMLSSFAKKHCVMVIGGSILTLHSESEDVTNTMFVFSRTGEELLSYDKIHLFRLMDEHKFLKAGNKIGLIEWEEIKIGLMICYDLRFPQLSRKLVNDGAKLLVNVAQWPTARVDHWRHLLIARAIENQSFVVAVNRCGKSGDTDFPGHSMVIDPLGKIVLEGNKNEEIYHVDINIDDVNEVRGHIPVITDQRLDLY
jgi:predicted amidohydrolase